MGSLIDLALNNQHIATIDTSRNVKPEQPKGHLVDTPVYMAPVEYVKDLAKDTYGIVKGINGKANDHELGKQNDVAMRIGGLAIAAYLSTYRLAKLPKLMEFVGLGSFFTSMALWPKLAIALPLKMRTGVDIQQKYVDSYGRKKNFFQDNQYLPWDLYSKDQIQKLGDKMKVPYDVPNRDEVIQEKARKMAVQGNTLWLATAGFATPIMTGLICKGLEPVVDTLNHKYNLARAEKLMRGEKGFTPAVKAEAKAAKEFESFLADNIGKEISSESPELLRRLNWSTLEEIELNDVLKKDLAKILDNAQGDVTPGYATKIYEKFSKTLSKAGITKEELSEAFKNNGFLGDQQGFVTRYRAINPKSTAASMEEATKDVIGKLLTQKVGDTKTLVAIRKIKSDEISSVISDLNKKVLDEKTAGQLRKVFNRISGFFTDALKLREWEKAHYVNSADSSISFAWERAPKKILSVLNLSTKELDELGKEGSKTAEILERKIAELTSDPQKYKRAVSKIAEAIAEFDTVNSSETRKSYRGFVDRITGAAKRGLKEIGFDSTAEYIGGRELKKEGGKIINFRDAMSGTVNLNRKNAFDNAVLNTKSSLYRFLQLLDFHKRLNSGVLEKQFDIAIKDPSVRFQTVVEEAKNLIMSGGQNSHVNKLEGRVGEKTYQAIMRLLYGALPENYARQATVSMSRDMAVRRAIYQGFENGAEAGYEAALKQGLDKIKLNQIRTGFARETIEALYDASIRYGKKTGQIMAENQIDVKTGKLLPKLDLLENIRAYTQTFIDKVVNAAGNFCDFNLKGHKLTGVIQDLQDSSSPKLVSSLIGTEPTEIIRTASRKMANNRRWLKKFGIIGGILLAGTMFTTLFFGHIPEKDMYMREDEEVKNDKKLKENKG